MGMELRNSSKRYWNSPQRNSDDRWQLQRCPFADNLAANNLLSNETARQSLLRQGNPNGITLHYARNRFLDTLVEPISQAIGIKLSLHSDHAFRRGSLFKKEVGNSPLNTFR